MRTVYIISNSLKSLCIDEMFTSSNKYEYNFAKQLSKHTKVIILTLGLNEGTIVSDDDLELVGVDNCNVNSKFKNMLFTKTLKCLEPGVVIFWSYIPFKVVSMLLLKWCSSHKIIQFVYDSHKPSIKNLGKVKKIILNIFFGVGKILSRFFDGYIFFQEKAAKRLRVERKPYLVIKPAVEEYSDFHPLNTTGKFLVTYCGTFSTLNCIDVFLESLPYFKDLPIAFEFYGYGLLKEDVMKAAEKFDYFKYGGSVNNEKIKNIYAKSNLLLAPRILNDEAMDFAFPSKVFECIVTGVPVLTTALLNDEVFLENVAIIDKITPYDMYTHIYRIYKNYSDFKYKAQKAKEYILANYSFENYTLEILSFINKFIQ